MNNKDIIVILERRIESELLNRIGHTIGVGNHVYTFEGVRELSVVISAFRAAIDIVKSVSELLYEDVDTWEAAASGKGLSCRPPARAGTCTPSSTLGHGATAQSPGKNRGQNKKQGEFNT